MDILNLIVTFLLAVLFACNSSGGNPAKLITGYVNFILAVMSFILATNFANDLADLIGFPDSIILLAFFTASPLAAGLYLAHWGYRLTHEMKDRLADDEQAGVLPAVKPSGEV